MEEELDLEGIEQILIQLMEIRKQICSKHYSLTKELESVTYDLELNTRQVEVFEKLKKEFVK